MSQFSPAALLRLLVNVDHRVLVEAVSEEGQESLGVLLGRQELLDRLDLLKEILEAIAEIASPDATIDFLDFGIRVLGSLPIPFAETVALLLTAFKWYLEAEEGEVVELPPGLVPPEGVPEPEPEIPRPPPPSPLPTGLDSILGLMTEQLGIMQEIDALSTNVFDHFRHWVPHAVGTPWQQHDRFRARQGRDSMIQLDFTVQKLRVIADAVVKLTGG